MQHFSRVALQEMHREMIGKGMSKAQQEQLVCEERQKILAAFMKAAF